MPTTRRSTGGTRARAGPAKGQSTISFASKITKSVPKDTKKAVLSPSHVKVELPAEETPATPKVEEVKAEELKDDVKTEELKDDVKAEEIEAPVVPEKSERELKAEKITSAQIKKYWTGIEKARRAPRVHQQTLSVNDRVLRYFDVTSQYGPCIGISRMARWQRAERLGLNPPLEVLAVLMSEETKVKDEADVATSSFDRILNPSALAA